MIFPWTRILPEEFKNSESAARIFPVVWANLKQICSSRFDWSETKAPEGMSAPDSEQVESILMCGSAVYRKLDGVLYPLRADAEYDVYGQPVKGWAVLPGGLEVEVDVRKGDVFFFGLDCYNLIYDYAVRLTRLMQTLDSNLVTSRVQFILNGSTETLDDRMYIAREMVKADKVATIISSYTDKIDTPCVSTGAHLMTEELLTARKSIIAEFCAQIGLHQLGVEKSERLIVSEVLAGSDVCDMVFKGELEKRKKLAEVASWVVETAYQPHNQLPAAQEGGAANV